MNGSAARRAQLGDLVIIAAFGFFDDADIRAGNVKPNLVFVDYNNRIKGSRDHVPVQMPKRAIFGFQLTHKQAYREQLYLAEG